jgi:hypothetical protein
MAYPSWLAYPFAAVMGAVAVYALGRLVVARRLGRRNHDAVDVSHVLMGTAMVGMLVPRWNVLPDGVWEVVFALVAVYFLVVSVRFFVRHGLVGPPETHHHHLAQYLGHLVMAAAMLDMYWLGMPMTGSSGAGMAMSGPPSGGGDPILTLLIIAVLCASAVWQLDAVRQHAALRELVPSASEGAGHSVGSGVVPVKVGQTPAWLAPRLEVCCHIAMCVAMGYMLVLVV